MFLLAPPAFLPFVISSSFTQNKKERGPRAPQAPPLDPPLANSSENVLPSSWIIRAINWFVGRTSEALFRGRGL